MPNRRKSAQDLKKWLDNLQQESWQLELVVSGFAIFLVLSAKESVLHLVNKLGATQSAEDGLFIIMFFAGFIGLSWVVLLVNLLLHVVFRGLWISVVGLRYVSGDIHYRNFKLQPHFEQFLRRRLRSFDDYILFLEKLCSLIFAFTFLLIFISASFLGCFLLIISFELSLDWIVEQLALEHLKWATNVISYLLVGSSLIYLIDFLTLSYLKRIRWLAPIYYPFYRLMGWLTFARFYRPLYYNLIDDRFGRNFALALIPYLACLILLASIHYEAFIFMPTQNSAYLEQQYYEDTYEQTDYFRTLPSIPSRRLTDDFLEVFVPYIPFRDNPPLRAQCPDIPELRKNGFTVGSSSLAGVEVSLDSLLDCMQALYQLYLNDSLVNSPHYYFYNHPRRNNKGILFVLDLHNLPHGVHELRVQTPAILDDKSTPFNRLKEERSIKIVFYKN